MILLVEDNEKIVKGLIYALEKENYQVLTANSIQDARKKIDKKIDLIILDVSLPDGDGFTFYKEELKDIKTIFLTAKDSEDDIVNAFEMGALDYITKPFSTRELLARIKIILNDKKSNIVKISDITFDMDRLVVLKGNEEIKFSSLELKILQLLFININKVVTRENLCEHIWEWTGNDVYDNTITVYMKRIREKLGTDIIRTLKGIGYRIDYE